MALPVGQTHLIFSHELARKTGYFAMFGAENSSNGDEVVHRAIQSDYKSTCSANFEQHFTWKRVNPNLDAFALALPDLTGKN